MFQRLATQIREQSNSLVDQYDARLSKVPGYANLPQTARRDLEQQILQLTAVCLETNNDSQLIQYIRERAEQVLTHGFQPEWFQQAVTIPQDIIAPLVETVAESNFVWRSLGHAQTTAWEIVAQERRHVELTLRESEARYQTIFDSSPIMFWLKDAHNRTLRINKAAAELEGVEPTEVEGKSAYDLYPHEQAEAFYQDDLEVIRSNQPKLGIVEQHTSVGTGKLMWVETGKTPIHNDDGEVIGVLAFGVDVTERKQAEEILHQNAESQQRTARYLRATIEATNELTQIQGLDTLYRRTVELAREKFDVERCGLYLLDESGQSMLGTYGTDDQRHTTDERGARRLASDFEEVLTAQQDQYWVVRDTSHVFIEDSIEHTIGAGWVVNTILRGASGPIGILFNDRALSGQSVDTAQQEALAVYCSAVGSIVELKRAEEERRAALENERITSERLRTIVTAADELIRANDLDVLYRRSVELAREKLGVERCALYILDESREWVLGTFGTDAAGHTTDERSNKEPAQNHQVITMPREQQWVTFQTELKYWESEQDQVVGTGWNVATAIRSAAGPIGIMFNDAALSRKPYDEGLQQSLALYCSMLANIIENKRLELQIRQSLQLRSSQVQTSTEVAQEIAAALESEELFHRVVTLIKERFNYYHAQIFRYDPAHDAAVLVTGYGEVGQKMLAAKHQLPMGRGVVGTAAATGQSILAADVRQDADWQPNPNLPETHGELAVPIKLRDQVLGVLDVQSAQANTLTDDDRLLLEGLCGQIASAMESTRLLERLRRNEAQLSEASKIAKLAYWEYDVEKDLFHFNDQFYALFHTTVEQVGGYQISSAQYAGTFVYPDDLSAVGTEIERALNSTDRHYSRNLFHRIQYADGGVGYIAVDINIDRDENGKILRYYGANQDVTEEKLAELDLRKFKLGLERSTAAIFITDIQGVITYVNPAFEKVYGFTPEEAIGQTPRIIKSGLIPQDQYKQFWGTLLAGQTVAGEIINKAKDGRLIPVQGSNSAIEDEHGNILGFLALHNDVTERKQAEQELSRFRQGLEQASDAVFMTDVAGHITYVNPAFERIYGYTREEALGQTPRILKSGQLSQEFYKGFWQTLLNKQSVSGEKPNKTKDGRVIIVEDSNSPILDNAANLLGFLSTHRDITDRKHAEQALERSATLLHTIINTSRDLIYVKDTESRFLVASQATANLVGAASADDLIGKNDYDFFPYDLAHKYYTDEQKIIQAGEPLIDIEEPSVYPDGTKIWLSTTKVPYRSPDGQLEGLLGIGRDITERKRSEQRMEETLRETERLYAAVSHESWQAYRQTGQLAEGYMFDQALIQPADQVWEPEIAQALEQKTQIASRSERRAVAVSPLAVRGETIGALGIYDDPEHPLSKEDLQLIDAVAEQVALALESARLFDQNQRDAEREHTINRVTSRIRNARSVDEVLSIAAQELRLATRASRSVVEILPAAEPPASTGNGERVKA
jgi:PAS domain S-box-containing protein